MRSLAHGEFKINIKGVRIINIRTPLYFRQYYKFCVWFLLPCLQIFIIYNNLVIFDLNVAIDWL